MHTLLELGRIIHAFMYVRNCKLGDLKMLEILALEARVSYMMRRGNLYNVSVIKLHRHGVLFVASTVPDINDRRVYSSAKDTAQSVICEKHIALNGFWAERDCH
jgi:hypothetical protein